jgi:hypothetical protein
MEGDPCFGPNRRRGVPGYSLPLFSLPALPAERLWPRSTTTQCTAGLSLHEHDNGSWRPAVQSYILGLARLPTSRQASHMHKSIERGLTPTGWIRLPRERIQCDKVPGRKPLPSTNGALSSAGDDARREWPGAVYNRRAPIAAKRHQGSSPPCQTCQLTTSHRPAPAGEGRRGRLLHERRPLERGGHGRHGRDSHLRRRSLLLTDDPTRARGSAAVARAGRGGPRYKMLRT